MTVEVDIQKLNAGVLVELFVLDITPVDAGAGVFYFHAGTNALKSNIIWQGNSYAPWPVEASGFEKNSSGRLPRPTLSFGNVLGTVGTLARDYDDLVGAKVLRKRTFVKYLDAENFPSGLNPTADPNEHLPDDEFFIDQKTAENKSYIEFALSAKCDLEGVKIPLRRVTQTCAWQYKGEGCGYVPGQMFNLQDEEVFTSAEDKCSKRISGCKARFGENATLPFGGFPGAGLIR